MPRKVSGVKKDVIRSSHEDGAVDKTGVTQLTLVERVPFEEIGRLLRAPGSAHPHFTGLFMERATLKREPPGAFYLVTYIFAGTNYDTLPDPEYELSGSLSSEAIETIPHFESIAGKPSAPLNGAVFVDPETGKPTNNDEVGVFLEFSARKPDGSANRKAGVDSYANPGLMWTKIYATKGKPTDLANLGNIDEPEGGAPSIGARDWLLWDFSWTKRGGVYRVRKSWKLSGPGGWDPDIYGGGGGE